MQIKKRQVTLVVVTVILLVIVAGIAWTLTNRAPETCTERGMTGKCLPEGRCVAPNDAIVSCEKLQQNPTKTDWFGNE